MRYRTFNYCIPESTFIGILTAWSGPTSGSDLLTYDRSLALVSLTNVQNGRTGPFRLM